MNKQKKIKSPKTTASNKEKLSITSRTVNKKRAKTKRTTASASKKNSTKGGLSKQKQVITEKAQSNDTNKKLTNRRISASKLLNNKYGKNTKIIAFINQRSDCDQFELLEETLEKAGFWQCLERRIKEIKKSVSSLRIIIKPDMEVYDLSSPTGTDPRLVEYLITLLHRRGYSQVSIADGIGSSDLWLENRDVTILAELAGYRYRTEDGNEYNVINLSENLIQGDFPSDSILAGSKLAAEWIKADFRINFAKNKTHQEYGYSLGIRSIIGALPLRDKEYHYFHRFDPGEVCIELLKRTPVHFAIIDAVISNHGSDGVYSSNPISTDTIIAGENLLLCDFAAAFKMGLDPYISKVNAEVLRKLGLPERYKIQGNLIPYSGWINVPVLLSDSVYRRNKSVLVRRMAQTWLQTVNRDIFPFKNDFDERINSTISRWLRGTDNHPLGMIGTVGINYIIAWLSHAMQAYEIMYNKEKVRRRFTSLGIDLSQYSQADFEKIVTYMEPLARVVAQTPPDRNGLRWKYIDHSVVFEYKRILPISYKKFISRVDISAAVRMLNDNIGGSLKIVRHNNKGNVTHQAERNIYLPQPNWLVFFGGDVIDVGKLEYILYKKNQQQIFWKAVNSTNQSARLDDGLITFSSAGNQSTEITIVARQEFNLPLFWQVFNIDYIPQIKDALVSDSYISYFSRTIANYEAVYEGRDPRTGRDWDKTTGEAESEKPWIPVEQLVDSVIKFAEVARPLISTIRQSGVLSAVKGTAQAESGTDENPKTTEQFFSITMEAVRVFIKDFLEALRKDAVMMGQMTWKDS